jgi:peptidoglycan/LPS O-acetylase OafA/YrhL
VYLVHWPVGMLMSTERMRLGSWHMTGWLLIVARFAVSVGLGYAIFRWVERPMRHGSRLPGRSGLYAWAGAAAAAIALAAIATARQ